LLDLGGEPGEFAERLRAAEERVYRDPSDPLTSWSAEDYARAASEAGLEAVDTTLETHVGPRLIHSADVERWLGESAGRGDRGNYRSRLGLSPEEGERLHVLARAQLAGKEVSWTTVTLVLRAGRAR